MFARLYDLLTDRRGSTKIEYVLLIALITLGGVASGSKIADSYNSVSNVVVERLDDAESKSKQQASTPAVPTLAVPISDNG